MSDANLPEIAAAARSRYEEAEEGYNQLCEGLGTLEELGLIDEDWAHEFTFTGDRTTYRRVQELEAAAVEAEGRATVERVGNLGDAATHEELVDALAAARKIAGE